MRVVGYVNCYTKCGQWLSLNILYSFIKQIFITCLPCDRHDSRPCGHEQTTQVQILPSCSSQYIEWFVFYRSLWPLSEELTIKSLAEFKILSVNLAQLLLTDDCRKVSDRLYL